jgi:regulator of nonsense transcripts 2
VFCVAAVETVVRELEAKDDVLDEDDAKSADEDGLADREGREDNDEENLLPPEENEDIEDLGGNDEGDLSEVEAARMMEKMRLAEVEDDDFEKAFRSVMQDSIDAAKLSTVSSKTVDVNMARPAVLPKPKNVFASYSGDDYDGENTEVSTKAVPFKMLSRDGRGKVEARQLLIPEDSQMALRLAKAEALKREEKMRLKQRILQLDSQAEDDLEESDASARRNIMLVARTGRDKGQIRQISNQAEKAEVKDLNLSDFLAESSAAERRRFDELNGRSLQQNSTAGRGRW